jgi:hypothetical protein
MRQKTEGLYMRRVLMPDGKVYEVSGLKGIKALKSIRKYMFECEQYKKEYFENPKYQTCTFEEAVIDYNNMLSIILLLVLLILATLVVLFLYIHNQNKIR